MCVLQALLISESLVLELQCHRILADCTGVCLGKITGTRDLNVDGDFDAGAGRNEMVNYFATYLCEGSSVAICRELDSTVERWRRCALSYRRTAGRIPGRRHRRLPFHWATRPLVRQDSGPRGALADSRLAIAQVRVCGRAKCFNFAPASKSIDTTPYTSEAARAPGPGSTATTFKRPTPASAAPASQPAHREARLDQTRITFNAEGKFNSDSQLPDQRTGGNPAITRHSHLQLVSDYTVAGPTVHPGVPSTPNQYVGKNVSVSIHFSCRAQKL